MNAYGLPPSIRLRLRSRRHPKTVAAELNAAGGGFVAQQTGVPEIPVLGHQNGCGFVGRAGDLCALCMAAVEDAVELGGIDAHGPEVSQRANTDP